MKKSMKNVFSYALVLIAFSITAVLGGFIFNVVPSAKAEEGSQTVVTISNAGDLNNYIYNYDETHITDNIVLGANIDMVDQALDGTIGTAEHPFAGTFDGKGYSISNFKIGSGADETDAKYFALFGETKGATISNLSITGKLSYTIDKCLNAYVGVVVAKANDTTINNLQITPSQVQLTSSYACNMKFGLIAGLFVSGNANYVICRTANVSAISLSGDNNNIYEIGGMFGNFDNSSAKFMVCSAPINVSATNTFVGKVNCGGFAGTITQGGSEIVNVAMHNTMTTSNTSMSTANFGQIAGAISNPAPAKGAISHIHYKDSAALTSRFGSMGGYRYNDEASYDHIAPSTYELNNLTTETGKTMPTYFENQTWHSRYSWDFEETWYSSASMINLQSFYGNFSLSFSTAFVESTVLQSSTTLNPTYRYGDKVTMEFEFKDVVDGEFSINMDHFYTLDKITRGGVPVATINTITNGEEVSYSVSGSKNYGIEKTEDGFAITVKNINLATSGEYNVTTREKEFNIVAKTKLYDETDKLIEGAEPGYVYYQGTNATTPGLSITGVKYGYKQGIETRINPAYPANAFIGWYIEVADGEDIALSTVEVLQINFGSQNFTDNMVIYAKYQDNACVVTFTMTDGVSRIQFYNSIVEKTETAIPVAKTETLLRLEIFVEQNYEFNTETFIAELANKTNTGEEGFCELKETSQSESGEWYYLFMLDMSLLEGEYAEGFTVAVQATEIEDKTAGWIWYAVGGGAGALVLAIVIVLIVVLKRRGGGGGGSYGKAKSASSTKKGFKNMYY